ncbi:hypothetical protein [Lacibacter sediminis]|uniref:Uncharacterized protein n=1 Tax=Lacibacter sediminis TaxID=2760713 RepID=A0A7G5XJU0_9BACT|nr:hypothetical protein [Lacibacter sediminis]QNA45743.1 hypothetical protein H4075_05975 [Lacibacter sediminis]
MYQIWFDQSGVKKMAKDIAGLQPSGSMLSETYILTLLKAGFLFSLFYMLALVVHIVITLILVKKHSNLFVKNTEK